jgi:hypothetical protein
MLIVSTTGATNIGDKHLSTDSVFDVPADVADHLLQFPGWRQATEGEAIAFVPTEQPYELKGAALAEALEDAGLPKTGTADEKRASLIPPTQLKGAALEEALKEAGLPNTGTADEKRASLAPP